jgi:hypothetical protein
VQKICDIMLKQNSKIIKEKLGSLRYWELASQLFTTIEPLIKKKVQDIQAKLIIPTHK